MTTTIYGIKACDTMKKARTGWMVTASPTSSTTTRPWVSIARAWRPGARRWAGRSLLNKAGTTFRKLPDADKQGIDEAKAIDLMLAHPSMIKRPVLADGRSTAGRIQA